MDGLGIKKSQADHHGIETISVRHNPDEIVGWAAIFSKALEVEICRLYIDPIGANVRGSPMVRLHGHLRVVYLDVKIGITLLISSPSPKPE